MSSKYRLYLILLGTILYSSLTLAETTASLCDEPGSWITNSPGDSVTDTKNILEKAKVADFVLLGEQHDQASHHRWQAQMIASLTALRDDMVIGLEMLPRSAQNVLDQWVEGTITLPQFISQSEWYDTWRFDIELYLPILELARDQKIPLVALNVPQEIISQTSQLGWENVEHATKTQIGDPAPASTLYRKLLTNVFGQHEGSNEKSIAHFIEAQLVWDRSFAQGMLDAKMKPTRLVIGIIGSGHLQYGYGVTHQLSASGDYETVTFIPTNMGSTCSSLDLLDEAGEPIADALFVTYPNDKDEEKKKLGVYLIDSDSGPVIGEIIDGSIALQSGLEVNDTIISAAGRIVKTSAELVAIIQKQTPGYWLPLTVKRDGKQVDIIAKIPPLMNK